MGADLKKMVLWRSKALQENSSVWFIYGYLLRLYNRRLSSGDLSMAEDWEEKMLEQMEEMFRSMGMNIDIEQLRGLMDQFRDQFESMGLDAERLAKGDVNFNFDLSKIMKLFQSGMSPEEMLSNLGVDIKVDAKPAIIDIEDEILSDEMLKLRGIHKDGKYWLDESCKKCVNGMRGEGNTTGLLQIKKMPEI